RPGTSRSAATSRSMHTPELHFWQFWHLNGPRSAVAKPVVFVPVLDMTILLPVKIALARNFLTATKTQPEAAALHGCFCTIQTQLREWLWFRLFGTALSGRPWREWLNLRYFVPARPTTIHSRDRAQPRFP